MCSFDNSEWSKTGLEVSCAELLEGTVYMLKKSMEKLQSHCSTNKKENWSEKESMKGEGSPSSPNLMIPTSVLMGKSRELVSKAQT